MSRSTVVTLLVTAARLAAQDTPLDAFRANIAAIHARDRAAYLSRYLHTAALARVGPDGLRQGYDDFARGTDAGWPDTLVATHLRIVPVSPDVAYGVYRYRVVDSSGSARGVSERVFVRTPAGWRVAVTTAFPAASVPPPPMALVGGTLVDGTGAAPLANAVVVMRGGRIACAGSRGACPVPADADTVSAAGKWIIPGLIDAHVHLLPDRLGGRATRCAGPARPLPLRAGRGGAARHAGAFLPLLPLQRRHRGVRRGRLPVDARASRAHRPQHHRSARRGRGPAALDDRLLAQSPRSAPVHLHVG